MVRNRLFHLFIAIALALLIALTVREAAATAGIIAETNSAREAKTLECLNLPSRYSIQMEYVQEAEVWVARTEDAPTGVDGGLIDLLSNYRTCSR